MFNFWMWSLISKYPYFDSSSFENYWSVCHRIKPLTHLISQITFPVLGRGSSRKEWYISQMTVCGNFSPPPYPISLYICMCVPFFCLSSHSRAYPWWALDKLFFVNTTMIKTKTGRRHAGNVKSIISCAFMYIWKARSRSKALFFHQYIPSSLFLSRPPRSFIPISMVLNTILVFFSNMNYELSCALGIWTMK